ncbi:unnamed protein product [Meganyctiphanes norvegica]|uniref:C2H2-type domain-containing protein n=1 Tax=Meganyctiphanes norvegica TaxID=48144 RepID=A0AAV2QN13_MEGNR
MSTSFLISLVHFHYSELCCGVGGRLEFHTYNLDVHGIDDLILMKVQIGRSVTPRHPEKQAKLPYSKPKYLLQSCGLVYLLITNDTNFQEVTSLRQYSSQNVLFLNSASIELLFATAIKMYGISHVLPLRDDTRFGSQSASPETKSESGLDEGLSISPGSPALDLVEFKGMTGLPTSSPDSPLVPLKSPSNKLQPSPHLLCSSPPAKRRRYKSVSSPLDDRIVNPISTKQREPSNSSLDEDCSVIKLITGNNGGHSLPSKSNLVIKMELQEDGEGVDDIMKRDGNDGVMGRSDHEAFLKEEEVIDDEDPLNTTLEDLSSLPPHLTANMQKLVSYAAEATSAEDNFSQLDNCTEPPDDQLLHQLEFTTRSHHYMHWPSHHPAVCPGCGKFFKFKYNMKIHLRNCTDV